MEQELLLPPLDESFEDEDDFLESFSLYDRAQVLMQRWFPEYLDGELSIYFCWKRSGGQSNGRVTLGKCTYTNGLLRHFSGHHFVIWLAADHAIDFQFDDRQLEAILYHELCHIEREDTGIYRLVGHDCELFVSEIERYGIWRPGLRDLADAFRSVTEKVQANV